MRIICATAATMVIGRRGENLATRVRFPTASWVETYGDGTFQLLVQRPNEDTPYPAALVSDGDNICWDVTSADTAIAGLGKCELQYYVGDVLAKSVIYQTRVMESLDAAGDVPEPYESWVEQVLQAGADAQEAAEAAEEALGKLPYPSEETGTWWLWDAESGTYVDSGVSYGGGSGLPPGGATGQYLVKQSDAVGDAAWSSLPLYDGAYEVTPLVNADTIMQTSGTYLDRNVVVQAIPYQEVSNLSGGKTATIGGNENG